MTDTRATLVRALGLPVLLPSLLYSMGYGAMMPVVAVSARQLHGSVPVAALVVACVGLGTLFADLPAGRLAGRFGERHAMLAAAGLTVLALTAFLLAPSLILLAVTMLVIGAAMSVWGLSRQTYVTETTPVAMRARALALLGATHRVGTLIGPFAGAGVIALGGTRAPFVFHGILSLATIAVLLVVPDPDRHRQTQERAGRQPRSTKQLLKAYFPMLGTLGSCVLVLGAMRASRDTLLPLWGHHIGLAPTQISLLSGILSGLELALFYPAGLLMDRKGRSFVAVPCLALMAIAHLLIPLSHSFLGLFGAIVSLGIGNGLGIGISMTLGADVSPDDARPEFLGIWRLVNDMGGSGGPVLVSVVSSVASLGVASVLIGGVGLMGAAGMGRYIRRWIPATVTRAPASG